MLLITCREVWESYNSIGDAESVKIDLRFTTQLPLDEALKRLATHARLHVELDEEVLMFRYDLLAVAEIPFISEETAEELSAPRVERLEATAEEFKTLIS